MIRRGRISTCSEKGRREAGAVRAYGQREDRRVPLRRVAMPRAPRLYAPGATMHVVARGNNRGFHILTPEDFAPMLGKLRKRRPVPFLCRLL